VLKAWHKVHSTLWRFLSNFLLSFIEFLKDLLLQITGKLKGVDIHYYKFVVYLKISRSTGATRPASYTMGTGGSFPGGVKVRPGRYADHSTPSSAEVKKE
jgi:hypothetical protein